MAHVRCVGYVFSNRQQLSNDDFLEDKIKDCQSFLRCFTNNSCAQFSPYEHFLQITAGLPLWLMFWCFCVLWLGLVYVRVSVSAGLREAQPFRYCFYSLVENGRHVAPINMRFGTRERTEGLHAKFHVYRGRSVGIQPLKLLKFRIFAINLWLRGSIFTLFLFSLQYFYEILSVCTPSQVAFKFFLVWSLSDDKQPSYKHFPSVGAFSPQIFNSP